MMFGSIEINDSMYKSTIFEFLITKSNLFVTKEDFIPYKSGKRVKGLVFPDK